jgi:predicted RNA-binding protein
MCEARVIVKIEGEETTVMEDAAAMTVEEDRIVVRNIMGERVEVRGAVEKVDLLSNVILIRGSGA